MGYFSNKSKALTHWFEQRASVKMYWDWSPSFHRASISRIHVDTKISDIQTHGFEGPQTLWIQPEMCSGLVPEDFLSCVWSPQSSEDLLRLSKGHKAQLWQKISFQPSKDLLKVAFLALQKTSRTKLCSGWVWRAIGGPPHGFRTHGYSVILNLWILRGTCVWQRWHEELP